MTGGTAAPGILLGYQLPEALLGGPTAELVTAAERAEAAGVHLLLLGDRPAAPPDAAGPPAAILTASVLAVRTRRIGLVVGAAPAYHEPYNLARMVASLDHISAGRAGWLVVTGPDPAADANHRREGADPEVGRQARAAEFVPLLRDLWDTWEDGGFVHEKETGRFIDPARVHVLDHVGPALQVRGPLNLIRPPQGHPVVLAPAAEPLVAAEADVLTVGSPDGARAARAAAGSRPLLGTVTPFVAPSEEAARDLHARAGAPASDQEHAVLVGDPGAVAQRLVDWVERGAVDGFTVRFPSPDAMAAFTGLVLPHLRGAGRFRGAYRAATLRGNLGLARPANRLVERLALAADRGRS
ncbi:alkanesulfonate monooxygenase SsuD/methylene tetrahydromethanopterin reductase-like flavin-dependent oxidoreductase (luciferase family) [Kitasatospora sp. MAP12-15]|uniref:LLM class flavin-dependent oxidoreductase n=1 Tax=unclassified Kitasatospora TaxID=2633591 RepID=UPI0024735BA7|nr:LLM class flavin-dependent oxidoreductase [Kitasatospora sp. MAP12-44]MDH6111731.1 alkanesulfonate monooxygenase SsuD/methylene tetrahydromethanopterin reductase-like flavin-dependent oxidoreductase (luciferase family) [Kitasatospora sp. MAP12-44]